MSRLLTLISLVTLLLSACVSQPQDCSRPDVFCVGLVTDFGDIHSGIAREAWLGLQDAKDAHLVDRIDVIETVEGRDRAANIKAFADQGYDVIVTVGASIGKDTTAAATKYPELHFIGIEQPQKVPQPNLAGLVFDEDRSGFLAGALAAFMTQTGHVAAVCEPKYIDAMRRYCDGFEAGAHYVGPHVQATVTYREGSPHDLFNAPDWGSQAASQQIHDGADVLFAAGGKTAEGALQTAAAEGAYVIGSETDRYLDLPAIRPRL
ncbi:MAG TPA: BMP family ABC transporter substrate-binding protein, partial [Anaerolineales bacterium]